MYEQFHNKKSLKEIRQNLRNNCTEHEAFLWEYLRKSKLGKKFRRQHSIGNYIVDFYCAENKLIIELDGSHHFTEEGKISDRERDENLKSLGFTVLRFTNSKVEKETQEVLNKIKSYL